MSTDPTTIDEDVKALLRRVRRIEVRARSSLGDHAAGNYRSRFRGQGMEFDRVRDYSAGDDVRSIDWNVTARAGRPFVKIFREERELSVMLVVDISGSMRFGGIPGYSQRSKLLTAAEAAAVMAVTALRNQDRVGMMLASDTIERHLPCRRGRNHVLRLVRELLGCDSGLRPGNLPEAIDEACRSQRRHSFLVVISDFMDPVLDLGRSLRRAQSRHEVVGIRIREPAEDDIPALNGPLWLADPEHGEVRALAGGRRAAARYRQLLAEQREGVDQAFRESGCDLIEVSTDGDVVSALSAFFRRRRSVVRG